MKNPGQFCVEINTHGSILNGNYAPKWVTSGWKSTPYACAWRADPPCFPSGECVGRESQLACQLFTADPVSQKVQRLKCRHGLGMCHELLRFLPALFLGQDQGSRSRGAEYRQRPELKPAIQFHPLFYWCFRRTAPQERPGPPPPGASQSRAKAPVTGRQCAIPSGRSH